MYRQRHASSSTSAPQPPQPPQPPHFGDLASFHLERCLGAYPVDWAGSWTPPEYWDADVHLPASEVAFEGSIWGTAEEYGDARLERCRAFLPVPGVLQTV